MKNSMLFVAVITQCFISNLASAQSQKPFGVEQCKNVYDTEVARLAKGYDAAHDKLQMIISKQEAFLKAAERNLQSELDALNSLQQNNTEERDAVFNAIYRNDTSGYLSGADIAIARILDKTLKAELTVLANPHCSNAEETPILRDGKFFCLPQAAEVEHTVRYTHFVDSTAPYSQARHGRVGILVCAANLDREVCSNLSLNNLKLERQSARNPDSKDSAEEISLRAAQTVMGAHEECTDKL
jgi:hypothetical protein